MGHIVQTRDCIQIPINRILSRTGSVTSFSSQVTNILGIFTVVSKKGDGFSLGPGNVKSVRVKGGKSFNASLSMINVLHCVPVGNVWRVTAIYQHLKM